jgi:hypothetical protein
MVVVAEDAALVRIDMVVVLLTSVVGEDQARLQDLGAPVRVTKWGLNFF